jgi:hypothetical protein
MSRAYRIDLSVNGGNARGAFNGGNIMKSNSSLNSGMYHNQSNGADITNSNLKKIFNLGLAFNTLQKGNEILGAYTENRLRQRRIDVGTTFVKYGIGIAINPLAGSIYAGSDLAYRSLQYGIKVQKKNREAEYYRRLSGNSAYSGSRYGGEYK